MNEKNIVVIGARLRQEREAKGFNKSQMAELGGCANSSYTNYEDGLREPGAAFLLNIAAKANVDIVYVLTGFRTDNTTKTNQEASLLQCFRMLSDKEKLGVNRLLSTLSGVADANINSSIKNPDVPYTVHEDGPGYTNASEINRENE